MKFTAQIKKILHPSPRLSTIFFLLALILTLAAYHFLYTQRVQVLSNKIKGLGGQIQMKEQELKAVKEEDQYLKNKKLEEEIQNIRETYQQAVSSYEKILDQTPQKTDGELAKMFAASLKQLSERNYSSASATLQQIDKKIQESRLKAVPTVTVSGQGTQVNTAQVSVNNTPPSSGYQRQSVKTEFGTYTVDIIAADLNNTKVIVDTASDSDCKDNCPVMNLGDYASRSGAFAGINGSFFCPSAYPNCAGKTNSFDTLLMNKNKRYFNSDNNVYSVVPAAIFGSGWARFVGQSLEWGRDTGVDAVIANHPLLLAGSNVVFSGNGDSKLGSKGPRTFVGSKDNIIYIGIVHGATSAEAAHALKALGLHNALGLDQGGSTALWINGRYIAGPGRQIPNALLFIRR